MRDLSESELCLVAGGDAGDVVVIGIRQQRQDGGVGVGHYSYADPQPVYGSGGHSAGAAPPPEVVAPSEYSVAAGVRVHVTDASHLEEAIDAATRIADALTDIEQKIADNPAASFVFNGQTYTGSQLQAMIQNTQWIVDDVDHHNGGVGAAAPGVDSLNYHGFSGQTWHNLDHSTTYASDYFAGQGIEAALLHEMAHMTQAGQDVHTEEMFWNRRDGGQDSSYYNNANPYHNAEEGWAHGFEAAAAAAFGISVNVYEGIAGPTYGTYFSGERIYAKHHPGSPNL